MIKFITNKICQKKATDTKELKKDELEKIRLKRQKELNKKMTEDCKIIKAVLEDIERMGVKNYKMEMDEWSSCSEGTEVKINIGFCGDKENMQEFIYVMRKMIGAIHMERLEAMRGRKK